MRASGENALTTKLGDESEAIKFRRSGNQALVRISCELVLLNLEHKHEIHKTVKPCTSEAAIGGAL